MNLIKSAVSAEPEACGADELHTVRSAYQAVLGELDRANAEIGRLREVLQQREEEISRLKSGQSTEDKHSKQRNMDELSGDLRKKTYRQSSISFRTVPCICQLNRYIYFQKSP